MFPFQCSTLFFSPGWGGEEAGRVGERPLHQHAPIFLCILSSHLGGQLSSSWMINVNTFTISGKRERDWGGDRETGQVHCHIRSFGWKFKHWLSRLHRIHLRHLQVCPKNFTFCFIPNFDRKPHDGPLAPGDGLQSGEPISDSQETFGLVSLTKSYWRPSDRGSWLRPIRKRHHDCPLCWPRSQWLHARPFYWWQTIELKSVIVWF